MPLDPSASSTRCARAPLPPRSASRPLASPLELSAVYRISDLDQIDRLNEGTDSGFTYAREGHPNAVQLAQQVADLEAAEAGLVCASGMAAIASVLLTLLRHEDCILLSEGLYGKTTTLVARELVRFGVQFRTFDPSSPPSLQEALASNARLVLVETVSNPLLRVADLEAIAVICRRAGLVLAVDHTFAPLLCRPFELGAHLVVHSVTKLIGGHSDLTQGVVVGTRDLIERIQGVAATFGLVGNPFESWLALRGLATLAVRSDRCCATALELARRLARHPGVASVHYPGIPSHPDFERANRMFQNGFGAVVTLDLGGREAANRFIRRLEQIPFAPSLGDTRTTLSHPWTTSHRGQDPETLSRLGISPGLIRLSVGLEDVEDLWQELSLALGP